MSPLHLGPNPTLHDFQQYVAELEQERGFAKNTVLEKYLLLSEEIGELAKCIRKSDHTNMRTDAAKHYDFDTAGEFGDILILLCALANRLDVDLEQAFRNKEEINKKRTWK
ncbi:MAG TPA: MazG nucleotide pyrophosphohydrolase domain-containing protein [Candidatus Saccharimonadales bacterium]|nr:MazG nucleotide pyrophosphohydrolase domain-containing protein [Candidatus Saccharimonadales bacterium]